MPPQPTSGGLVLRVGDYAPLRAFSQGGIYWDQEPQQIIRQGALAEFLPPVELESDDQGQFGRFHCPSEGRERLGRSRPLGSRGVPPDQLKRLKQAVAEFKAKALDDRVQPQNRQLIERFQLPDPGHDPELYRLAGPWWSRRLQILWGCERIQNSSLPVSTAIDKLPADRLYVLRRALTALLLLGLLALSLAWICAHWNNLAARLKSSPPMVASTNSPATNLNAGLPSAEATNSAPTNLDDAKAAAAKAAAEAKKARAEAEKARSEADRARKKADQSQGDVERRKKAADQAEDAAAKAEEKARQAATNAQRAMENARAAQKAADQAPRRPASRDAGKPSPGASAGQSSNPLPPADSSPTSEPGAPSTNAADSQPPSSTPAAAPRFEIVLYSQGQPEADGTLEVALEVRPIKGGGRAVPVESWQIEGQTIAAQNQLQTRLKGGEHPVKAVIRDDAGKRTEIEGVLSVEPGRVITTGGKASLRQKPAP